MTDEEFVAAIDRFGIEILSAKARELVKRQPTRGEHIAYERKLARESRWKRMKYKEDRD